MLISDSFIKSSIESSFSYSSFYSPTPHLSIPQTFFLAPLLLCVFLLEWSTLQRPPWLLFSLWSALCHSRARGAIVLLSYKWSPEALQWVKARSLRQRLGKGREVEREGDGRAPIVSLYISGLAFSTPYCNCLVYLSSSWLWETCPPLYPSAWHMIGDQ